MDSTFFFAEPQRDGEIALKILRACASVRQNLPR